MRRDELEIGEIYHIFTKSIAEYKIFNNEPEFSRMVKTICYYQSLSPITRFSSFERTNKDISDIISSLSNEKHVDIIAYCLMPTHIHLALRQLRKNGISIFMNNILNSYTRYFNTSHNRKGPLWESRFKSVLVENDEQLLHLTRYIHLNPVTAYLVDSPKTWQASSYNEYLSNQKKICNYADIMDIEPSSYKQFVEERIYDQRELAKVKILSIE